VSRVRRSLSWMGFQRLGQVRAEIFARSPLPLSSR